MKIITGSLINMYHVCRREMWLNFHNLNMEQTSELVYEGKLIGENTYTQRAERYTEISIHASFQGIELSAKIDFYDAENRIVHEVKKSDKLEKAHIAQVQFYLYVLESNGINQPKGILEYPKLRQTLNIPPLSPEEKKEIENWIIDINQILKQKKCPTLIKKTYCKTCSYHDFCFVNE
ncbi:MAG: CRISPR-associated protein Cas4 [Raineya sp.]